MFKWRDFYLMKVYDSKNKYIGVIEDISIDFSKGIIEGFTISPASIIKRHTFVLREDIVSIDNVMKITSTSKFRGLKFKDIKFFDVINEEMNWSEVERPNNIVDATDATIYEVHVRDVTIDPSL